MILDWLRRFDSAPGRRVQVLHVRAHSGNKGNELADGLAKKGSRLRHELMVGANPVGWFKNTIERYWKIRKVS